LIDKSLIDQNTEEHYVKKGDPNKSTYYIIRPRWSTAGLFAHFAVFAGHIRYALSKDWFPVVDMQNYPNAYLVPQKLGKENAWEYYFEQPMRIGLEEAYNGENVILGSIVEPPRPTLENILDHATLAKWRMLVKKGLLTIKPDIMKEVLSVRERLFNPTDRVLGVKLRGTDYNVAKYHPIPPPLNMQLML